VVKNRARDLLRAVADGGDVPIAQVYDLARAVIEAPPFQIAQEILRDASPEFALRRALELASLVLMPMTSQPRASQRGRGQMLLAPKERTTPIFDQVLSSNLVAGD